MHLTIRSLRLIRATFPAATLTGQAAGVTLALRLYGPLPGRFYASCAAVWAAVAAAHTAGVTIALRRRTARVSAR